MDSLDLNISINGPSAAVQAFMATIIAKVSSAPQTPAFEPLRTAMMPRVGEPWPGLPGSAYAGIAGGEGGGPDGHLVLLADKPNEDLTWEAALAWAESLGDGAHVPTRFESALLYANLQGCFDKDRYHWTSSQYSADYAWSQDFNYGSQSTTGKSYEARARALRRFPA